MPSSGGSLKRIDKMESYGDVSSESEWLLARAVQIRDAGLWRVLREVEEREGGAACGNRPLLNFSSNDYLGFRFRSELREAAVSRLGESGIGAGASRLVCGTKAEHLELETLLEEWLGASALVFGSGYLANLGLITALADRHTLLLVDRLAHASLLDGALLSRGELVRFHHNDLSHLEQLLRELRAKHAHRRILVLTESVFSMDGDLAPLSDMQELCETFGASLLVDEAHAVGVFGEEGRGLCSTERIDSCVSYRSATFSKAFGGYGGFVLGSAALKEHLINTARTFIYDTALPPYVAAAAAASVKLLRSSPELGPLLLERSAQFRRELAQRGIAAPGSSHIIPLIIGESEAAMRVSSLLFEGGVLAPAIRPPTVPQGTARIRFSISLSHSAEDLEQAAELLQRALERAGVNPPAR